MPYSPAHVNQCLKRIHRMGQECPRTHKVTITHLVPYGSVDYAIGRVHSDKERLINLIQEGDDSGFDGEDADSKWRRCGRIVDECKELGETGNFPDMPLLDPDSKTPKAFSLLSSCPTRGVPAVAPPPPAASGAGPSALTAEARSASAAALLSL